MLANKQKVPLVRGEGFAKAGVGHQSGIRRMFAQVRCSHKRTAALEAQLLQWPYAHAV